MKSCLVARCEEFHEEQPQVRQLETIIYMKKKKKL
jgi:hypothetical protein